MLTRKEAQQTECPYRVMGMFAASPENQFGEGATHCQADQCPKWRDVDLGDCEDLPCPRPCTDSNLFKCNDCHHRYGRCGD